MLSFKKFVLFISVIGVTLVLGCGNSERDGVGNEGNPEIIEGCPASPGSFTPAGAQVVAAGPVNGIEFHAVGGTFPGGGLIDLEFLPGRGGDAIVVAKDGSVYYVDKTLTPLSQVATVDTLNDGEQGMLNVVADPQYADNCMIYLYFTLPNGTGNRLGRFTVRVDHDRGAFTLSDPQTIIEFFKNASPDHGSNHNGGGLAFNEAGELFIAVGDGGGTAGFDQTLNLAQNTELGLGKIHRVIPHRSPGVGGFSLPGDGNNVVSTKWPSIFAYGLRNPFTIAYGRGALFIGDVGTGTSFNAGTTPYEEVNLAEDGGENFGWPQVEGPVKQLGFMDPLGGYDHESEYNARFNADAQAVDKGLISIIVATFYTGNQYGGFLEDTVIYTDFYAGFVRGLRLDANLDFSSDDPLGHQEGLTTLQEGPDGMLYGVSLLGPTRILRVDPTP